MKLHDVLLLQLIAVAFGQPETCSIEGTVKLAPFNPNDLHAGIVEVCHNGYWGTICTDSLTRSWSEKNAHIACWNVVDPVTQSHPYSGALNSIILSTLPKSYQVPQSVPIHYCSLVCDGTEDTLAHCFQISTNTSTCTHDYDAAVVCRKNSNYNDVRLVGSVTDGQGAVEMNIASYGWVRLCPEAFDLSGVCSKLGYTSTTYQTYTISANRDSLTKLSLVTVCVTMYNRYYYSYYDSNYDSTYYDSNIESYQSCTTEYTTVCNYASTLYAGVTCSNSASGGSVRLYGGSDPAIGNVEVLYNGVWGAVCATGWNEDAGRLVCAQLGYNPNNDYFGMGFTGSFSGQNYLKPIWLNNVNNCSHLTSKKITECSYTPPIGYGQGCSSANVATLQCDYVLTDGAIAGIVIGTIIFFIAICATIFGVCCCCVSTRAYKNISCSCQCMKAPRRIQPGVRCTTLLTVQSNTTSTSSNNATSFPSANPTSQGSNFQSQNEETRFVPEGGGIILNGAPPAYDESKPLPSWEVPVGPLPEYDEKPPEY